MNSPLTDPAAIRTFALAGRAHLTLVSRRTGVRFTYRVVKAAPTVDQRPPAWFVSVLTGPDNTRDYAYIGLLLPSGVLRHTPRAMVAPGAPSERAIRFFCDHVLIRGALPDTLEVWHEGRCGRCSRLLTDPGSIARGIGPECAQHVGD